jgi:hypothetical protein
MTENYEQMKQRKQRETEERRRAQAKAKTRSRPTSAKEIRSRHARMGKRLTTAEVKTLRAAMKLDLNQQQLLRAAEEEKRIADFAEGEAQRAESDILLTTAPLAPPIPVPPGRDCDAYLAEERENDIDRRVALEKLTAGLDLDRVTARIFRLLLAHSQVRGKNQGQPGWRYTDLAAIGADPCAILGIGRPEVPATAENLTTAQKPQPTAVERLEANSILGQGVERLRDLGLVRNVGLFVEVATPT